MIFSKRHVFTGLIQTQGIIHPHSDHRFAIAVPAEAAAALLGDLAFGDSVAVDGVCLTVEEILPNGFVATASPETLARTNLGQRSQSAACVNLETSLRVGAKLGGHFVTGHVDSVGCLLASGQHERAWEMTFGPVPTGHEQWQQRIARYLVPKGSIAVNGISLTVAECDSQGNWFKVAVIPLTYAETNLSRLAIGDWVNLEGDILGKYVDKLLAHHFSPDDKHEEISPTFLAEHGYV